jgi:hypothetical protein
VGVGEGKGLHNGNVDKGYKFWTLMDRMATTGNNNVLCT